MAERKLSFEDQVLLRMLKTPPKPHAEMKVGSNRGRKAKVSRAKRSRAEKA